MLKELMILKNLGVDGSLINYYVNYFSEEERAQLFNGGAFELQFKYNLTNGKHLVVFEDKAKLVATEKMVDNVISRSDAQNIKIISYYDDLYPSNLRFIKNSPLFLHVKGNLNLLKVNHSIACVGTRNPSNNTLQLIGDIIKGLVKEGMVIVSGLAKGIDAISHKECLDNNGRTIAVLAHGLDTIYPKENRTLSERIIEHDGVLVSEYPIGTNIQRSNFVARNRIVSGLSQGLIVFEADEKSGTMHTARYAYSQGKHIFCPYVAKDNQDLSTGIKKLLESGSAIPITNAKDVLNVLFTKVGIESSLIKELQRISYHRNISMEKLINSILEKYIEGEKNNE
ncbi:DNA-processing protein DprA [Halalkalibacter akibai]|uniref:Rossmann fold nucleotide-binding protein Smf n=1 Tax=Halalkalibacter akibai (strain ATCC 43226 / DSM 21942 / CIP 109018 / JCM 9157 / 1139) TaxID=1236973 RepID=W4QX56_HALA3|nr:DNA-processing protein DprA [Halalkalibacter akibai]GAE36467.1 Rossmann fold nucleotide-binding protein Smf [Halalkalibacter akibai JCM 9157]